MKAKILVLLLVTPMLLIAQVKGKKSKEPFKTSLGTEYKVGDKIALKQASNEEKYAFVYVHKSMFSLKNITKAVKSVRDVKNMNVTNVNQLTNNLDVVTNLASNDMINGAMAQLMGQAVSEDYVSKNALDASKTGNTYKIKSFKVYTDEDSGESIVHAIAKGNGQKIAILLDFAEKTGEISK